MLPRLHALPLGEFAALVARFPFTRRVTSLHLHHTIDVRHTDFRGLPTLEAMRRAHVDRERWSDIAQHVTIAPDGTLWTGRHWNRPPCSIAGQNGDRATGPLMIAVVGDFDEDELVGAQLQSTVEAIALVQVRFSLPAPALRLHRDSARTTCPGMRVGKRELVGQVAQRHLERRRATEAPTADDRRVRPFCEGARAYVAVLGDLQAQPLPGADESPLAEPAEVRGAATPRRDASVDVPTAFPRDDAPLTSSLGRRLALCVGIDAYPDAPLAGCVADARLWATTLRDLGFTTGILADERATREAIVTRLSALVDDAASGDVVVFQFAGHGTQVPDLTADERDRKDEALCPVDFADGHLLVDDDLAPIMDRIRPGVNVTCFIDCCHSGTVTRLAGQGDAPAAVRPADGAQRPAAHDSARFILATPGLIAAHRRFRRDQPRPTTRGAQRREVLFAACQPGELAWESNGQGDFTRKATRRLRDAARTATHQEFLEQVTAAFGPAPRQHPLLTCRAAARRHLLLAPLVMAV